MEVKPVKPALHGLVDYVFSGVQLIAPASLGLNKTAINTYRALGTSFLVVNALTDTPVALKPSLSFKTHQKADLGFLTTLSLLTFANFIRSDKPTLGFHLGFLGIAVTHYLLTDYKAGSQGVTR